MEACAFGKITNITFDACMSKSIDGTLMNIENQDGIDIRNGCHDIIISDIFGHTGDDVIAVTAYAGKEFKSGGSMRTTQVMPNDWTKRESGIRDIIIRNVVAHSHLCYTIRILSIETKITDIIVSGVIDTSSKIRKHGGTIVIGEPDGIFGNNLRDGVSDILISDIISNSRYAVKVKGYLKDSAFCNVMNAKDKNAIFSVDRDNGFVNVKIQN